MLIYLVDRVAWPTIIYAIAATGFWSLRGLTHEYIIYGALAAITAFYAQVCINHIRWERAIDKLGKRAPGVPGWTPFNTGLLASAVWHVTHHRNHEWWWRNFEKRGNPKNPWTVEAITIGQRIILTADEENVKAILATQFSDYGKGPQFRKEWKDFLGLSE